MKQKFDVSIIFQKFKKFVEKLFEKRIISFYSNNGGEFIPFRSFFEDNGIFHFSLFQIPLNIMQPPNVTIPILLKHV